MTQHHEPEHGLRREGDADLIPTRGWSRNFDLAVVHRSALGGRGQRVSRRCAKRFTNRCRVGGTDARTIQHGAATVSCGGRDSPVAVRSRQEIFIDFLITNIGKTPAHKLTFKRFFAWRLPSEAEKLVPASDGSCEVLAPSETHAPIHHHSGHSSGECQLGCQRRSGATCDR